MSICNINLMATVYVNLMSTVDVTRSFILSPMVNGQLTSTVDIILSIEHILPTGDTGGKMSVLCLVLIYICISFRALVEVQHVVRI